MDNPHRPPFLRALWEMILAYRPRPSVGGLRRLRILLPSPGNVLFTLLVVGGLFWAGSVGAVPLLQTAASSTNTVAYQGRLADATGNPVTATTPMVFRLYNAATGGTPLWEENWTGSNSVHVSDGLFNVMLGSLTQIPQSVVTGNSNLWLGITVNADNEMQPRVQLGTVPFAVQALTVPDGSITAAKLAPSISFVPPDGSITTAKIADGAVNRSKLSDNALVRTITDAQAKIQYGITPFNTTTCGRITITFPQPFTQIPIVVITQHEASANTGSYVTTTVAADSFQVAKLVNCTTAGNVDWIAIGN